MNKKLLLTASCALLTLVGCGSTPKLASVLPMPNTPTESRELIEVHVEFKNEDQLEDNAVQLRSHQIAANSSVVINVPSNLFAEQSNKDAENQNFKTQDFFNKAEQQIERVLIRNGFRVISRSKFEAKLRALRDESRCDTNNYACLHSRVSPELRPILEELKTKFDNGKINAIDYAEQITLFKNKLQTSSAGRRRGENENELTDISEVIRAAESGNVQADYILQINLFDTENKLRVNTDLRYQADVRQFLREHPAIKNEFENGHNIISCAVVGSKLNAKLVHVKTGEIAWIGEHQLNEFSSGVQQMTIEMGSRKYASNTDEIQRFVAWQNTATARLQRYGQNVSIPEYKFTEALIEPTISSGRCEQTWSITTEQQSKLARNVAKALINTIKVKL